MEELRKPKMPLTSSPLGQEDSDRSWSHLRSGDTSSEEVFYFSPGTYKSGTEHDSSSGISSLGSPSGFLNISLVKSVSQKDELIKSLEYKLSNIESYKTYLESEVQQLLDENDNLKSKLQLAASSAKLPTSETSSALADLQTQFDDLSDDLSKTKGLLQDVNNEKLKLVDQLAEARNENYVIVRENINLSTDLDDTKRQIHNLETEFEHLHKSINVKEDEIQALQTMVTDKNKQIRILELEITELKEENQLLKSQNHADNSLVDEGVEPDSQACKRHADSDTPNFENSPTQLEHELLKQIEQLQIDFDKCQQDLIEEKRLHGLIKKKMNDENLTAHKENMNQRGTSTLLKATPVSRREQVPMQRRNLNSDGANGKFSRAPLFSGSENNYGSLNKNRSHEPRVVKTPFNQGRSKLKETSKENSGDDAGNYAFQKSHLDHQKAGLARLRELQTRNRMVPPHMRCAYATFAAEGSTAHTPASEEQHQFRTPNIVSERPEAAAKNLPNYNTAPSPMKLNFSAEDSDVETMENMFSGPKVFLEPLQLRRKCSEDTGDLVKTRLKLEPEAPANAHILKMADEAKVIKYKHPI